MTQFTPFTHNFLQSILSSIDSKDPVVANAWLDTLLDVIDLLPIEVLGKEVLEIAVSKAGDSQPTFSRLGSCQLVGKLGMKLEQQVIQDNLIPVTQNLSQDAEWTIRASMCAQLVSIIKGLTKNGENVEAKIPVRVVLSVLFELGDDEVEAVRLVVIETASTVLQYLDQESVQTLMVPWLQKICERASKEEDKTLPLLAQHWARISRTLQAHLNDVEKEWFVDYFYRLSSLGSAHATAKDKSNMPDVVAHTADTGQKLEIYAEVRHACAVNSAAMVSFIGAEPFAERVSCLRALAADPYFVVRRAVAANMLELCRQLHPVSSAMHPLLIQLLIDPCSDVTFALVPQIGAVLEHLARLAAGPLATSESVVVETCEAVLRCEEQVMNGSSWRVQADMLSQLAAFPLCLPCQPVHDLLIPRLWHRIETVRPLPCRVSAAQTLMLCVRSERRSRERAALCDDIIARLAAGKSCHRRMLFLRVCPVLFDLLSRKFIRQHFFLPIVRLAGDKVANVRLRFASLLPKLHVSLRGLDVESEKRLIVELDSAVRWLVDREKDRDVKTELAAFFRWIDEQEGANRTEAEEDEADRRKESDEDLSKSESLATTTAKESANFFPKEEEPSPPPTSCPDERPLDPSTDDFYRDAGVRLPAKNAKTESRIPSTSRLRPPLKTSTTLPHFGIARGVQQVQPQPSIAYGVAPPMRNVARRVGAVASLNAAKSRSQENLNVIPKPRAARPVSTCLGPNDLLSAAGKQNPFVRNRQRASISGPAPTLKQVAPPIATLPRPDAATKWRPAKVQQSVKLSDMKNALPVTPVPPRKTTTEQQPWKRRPSAADEAQQMMESLRLGGKPESLLPIQRRTAWRRSLHFTTATSSPPPPPPRKNFATLPAMKPAQQSVASSTNNNNIVNNNNNIHQSSSKLPVPASKRNSHLSSNF